MRECPKCSRSFDDDSKICRTCGTILEDRATEDTRPVEDEGTVEEPPVLPEIHEEPRPEVDAWESLESEVQAEPKTHGWRCPQCESAVPDEFDVCWKCGSDQQGEVVADVAPQPSPQTWVEATDTQKTKGKCIACGSSKIIPGLTVVDQGQHSDGKLYTVVYGDPDALIFKDKLHGEMVVDVCGSCGHAQLRVVNPGELYRHWRDSQR